MLEAAVCVESGAGAAGALTGAGGVLVASGALGRDGGVEVAAETAGVEEAATSETSGVVVADESAVGVLEAVLEAVGPVNPLLRLGDADDEGSAG